MYNLIIIKCARINNSFLKPLDANFKYGRNPGEVMAKYGIVGDVEQIANRTNKILYGMKDGEGKMQVNGIVHELENTAKALDEKAISLGGSLGQAQSILNQSQVQTKNILKNPYQLNLTDSFQEIDNGIKSALKMDNTTVANKLESIKKSLLNNLDAEFDTETGIFKQVNKGSRKVDGLTFSEAWNIRKDIKDYINWKADTNDDLKVNGIVKNLYDRVNDDMDKYAEKLDPILGEQWSNLNQDYAGLTNLVKAADHRYSTLSRANLLSLPTLGLSAVTGLYGLSDNGGEGAGKGALAGMVAGSLLKNPQVMSRVAKQLYKANKGLPQSITKLIPSITKTVANNPTMQHLSENELVQFTQEMLKEIAGSMKQNLKREVGQEAINTITGK